MEQSQPKKEVLADHSWPDNQAEHIFGEWMGYNTHSQWRKCVHPNCKYFEIREVKRG